jgi:hypothetical protein
MEPFEKIYELSYVIIKRTGGKYKYVVLIKGTGDKYKYVFLINNDVDHVCWKGDVNLEDSHSGS